MAIAVIDLPQPDSPTNANVSPALIVSDRASTALDSPDSVTKSILRPSTFATVWEALVMG